MKPKNYVILYEELRRHKPERGYAMTINHGYSCRQCELLALRFVARLDFPDLSKVDPIGDAVKKHQGEPSELVEKVRGMLE